MVFTHRLDRGVARLESGLRAMEQRIDTPVPATHIPELDRVGTGIGRLAAAVQEHQQQRAEMESRLHRVDRLAALGRLVGGVAHEIRNPLASIRLKLHLVQRSSAGPEGLAEAFQVIDEEISRLDRLVDRLLTLAKPAEPSRLPIDVERLLRTRIELWTARAAEHGIALQLEAPSGPHAPLPVDADRLAQILDNLVANAIDVLTTTGGRVILGLERPAVGGLIITVGDTGPGVPPGIADHLFEPFTTTRPGGTGLGLFLSAELARSLGGELRHRERPEGGTRFEVRLPC